jgi:two-component system NtrC family sensor kinase
MWELVIILLLILSMIFSLPNKREGLLWISVILTAVAIGAVADILRMSYLEDEVVVGNSQYAMIFVLFSFIFFHVSVYAFLMFALSFYRVHSFVRKAMIVVGLVPIIYDSWHTPFIPSYEINYGFIFWLWLIYIGGTTVLIIYKYVSTPPSVEKSHFLAIIFIYLPPPWLGLLTLVLPLYLFGVGGELPYFRIILQLSVCIAFLLNLYYVIFPGFLGIRLIALRKKAERRLVTSGVEVMNHSLKNGANKLLFMSRELKSHDLSEEERHNYMQLIEQSASEMAAMLEKLNSKTREVTIKIGVHTVEELLDNVREKCAALLHQHQIRLTTAVSYNGTLQCDLQLLADDLSNLIDNSIHAVAKCSKPVIRIEIGAYGRYACITLYDNGYGIPKEHLNLLFEPYFTTKNKSNSFGIGLYACYNNVAAQRGLIHIESEEGMWTKVNVYIRKGD